VGNLWLASYAALWGLSIVSACLIAGLLRQIGLLRLYISTSTEHHDATAHQFIPTIEEDGPELGSAIPEFTANTVNDFGSMSMMQLRGFKSALIIILSPMCEGCQKCVEAINAAYREMSDSVCFMAILKSDDFGARAFLSVFPLSIPVICSGDHEPAINLFHTYHTPLALFYGEDGVLVRKGTIEHGRAAIDAVIYGREVSPHVAARIYPAPNGLRRATGNETAV